MIDMTLIYRLETIKGEGIFANSFLYDLRDRLREAAETLEQALEITNTCPTSMPGPYEDRELCFVWEDLGVNNRHKWFFGCRDCQTLFQWLKTPTWRRALRDAGVTICIYQVPTSFVHHGTYQSVFRKDCAHLIEQRRIPVSAVPELDVSYA